MDNIFFYNNISTEYAAIIRKFQRVLEAKSISMSLRQLKSFDTIELTGTAANGRERVLINEVKREYGTDALLSSEAARILLPFIPEGVLKARSKDGIYYTYFRVEDPGKDSGTFNLVIADHQLCDGIFQLRYYGHAVGLPKVIAEENPETGAKFASEGFPDFMEKISDEDLMREMSEKEAVLIREAENKALDDGREQIKQQVQKAYDYLLSTFRAINFLNEQKRLAVKSALEKSRESTIDGNADRTDTKNGSKSIAEPIRKSGPNSSRTITMGDWYTYRSQKPKGTSGKAFVRRTEQWLVTGHVRHYKSGKTVYINPYYKGPGREKGRIGKTVIKVKERKN